MLKIYENDSIDEILIGLCEECPIEGENNKECQFYYLRKLSIKERWIKIRKLNLEKKMAMHQCYKDCYKQGLEKTVAMITRTPID